MLGELTLSTAAMFMLSTILFYFIYLVFEKSKKDRLPGPFPWPIVGNMLQLGENPHLTLTKWRELYGDVYQIKLGANDVVVLNGKEVIQENIGGHNSNFAMRPDMDSYRTQANSMVFARHSLEQTKYLRKLVIDSLKNCMLGSTEDPVTETLKNGAGKMSAIETYLSSRCESFVKNLIDVCEVEAQNSLKKSEYYVGGRYSPILAEVNWEIVSILCHFIYGKTYTKHDKDFQTMVRLNDQFSVLIGTANLSDTMPWIKYIVPGYLNKYNELVVKLEQLFWREYKDHTENEFSQNQNILGYLLVEWEKSKKLFDKETSMLAIIVDMYAASTDTTPKSMEWILSYAAAFPDIQQKMQVEIDNFVNKFNRMPSYSERNNLPQISSFILEVRRYTTTMPFTIPHAPTKRNLKINGYKIPNDCSVFVNQFSVNYDTKYWGTPEHFRPERFLTKDGKLDGKLEHQIMLFGTGRRKCPGKAVAEIILFHMTVYTLRNSILKQGDSTPGLPKPLYGLSIIPQSCHFSVVNR